MKNLYLGDNAGRCQTLKKNMTRRQTESLWSLVLVELTSHCNFNCSFCPRESMDRKKSMMSRALWERILYELAEKKMTAKVFFHLLGEPLLHKDLFDAIRLANCLGLSVSLYTNGYLLNKNNSFNLLTSLKKGLVVLSMQDISPASFAKRCRGAISWEKYVERLQNFMLLAETHNNNVSVQVHCMANIRGMGNNVYRILQERKNIQAIYDQWRNALGVKERIRINIFNPTISYPLGEKSLFFVKQGGNWDNQLVSNEVEIIPRSNGHCVSVTDTFAVLSDGTCTYCCNDYEGKLNLGNAYEKSIEDIYYGEKATKIREAVKKNKFIEKRCRECRGSLVFKKSGKPVPSRNILTDFYIFKEHLALHGTTSAMRKVGEAARRRYWI
jgi:radical SAM protein with 4Fe4S-binding SPASM domain